MYQRLFWEHCYLIPKHFVILEAIYYHPLFFCKPLEPFRLIIHWKFYILWKYVVISFPTLCTFQSELYGTYACYTTFMLRNDDVLLHVYYIYFTFLFHTNDFSCFLFFHINGDCISFDNEITHEL